MTAPLQWSSSFTGANFDAMRVYDEVLVPRLLAPWAERLLDIVELARGDAVLDVACGPGTVACLAAKRIGADGRVIACDLNPAMLAIAQSKAAASGAARLEYVECPADALPVPTATFDVATCQQGLQFFPDRVAALAEMRRALRPGGRLAVAVWSEIDGCPPFVALASAVRSAFGEETALEYRNGPWGLPRAADLKSLLERAGFRDVGVTEHRIPVVFEGGTFQLISTLAAAAPAPKVAVASADARRELVRSTEQAVAALMVDGEIRSYTTSHIATATA